MGYLRLFFVNRNRKAEESKRQVIVRGLTLHEPTTLDPHPGVQRHGRLHRLKGFHSWLVDVIGSKVWFKTFIVLFTTTTTLFYEGSPPTQYSLSAMVRLNRETLLLKFQLLLDYYCEVG